MADDKQSSILPDKYALGISLDIKGAFDNLSVEASIWGMVNKGLPPQIIRWYSHYLSLQSIMAKIKGVSTALSLTRGTPQGGMLSPLVWNLTFNDLLDRFNSVVPAQVKGFADDAAIVL